MDHVVISGAGIAGTTAALALRTAGIEVTVLEARAEDDEAGAVVRVNPNGMDALRAIGAHQQVIGVSFPLVRVERVGADGARVGFRLAADPTSDRGMPRVLHWTVLARSLRELAVARGARFRYGGPVVAVEHGRDEVSAVLGDGSRVTGDVLVGADGVRSRVRASIDADAPAPTRLGTRTVYGFAREPRCEPPPPEVLRSYLGARGFFAATRDSRSGGCFWFTSLRAPEPSERAATVDELRGQLLDLFGAEPSIAPTVIENSEVILSFDDHALGHLPRWFDDRSIVIGDALHVAPPASEQGAAIGIEDGVILARCLRDARTPREAFTAFERRRRERVEAVVALGTEGTTRAHRRRRPALASRIAGWCAWQRRIPTGGPAWAYDHHIEWSP